MLLELISAAVRDAIIISPRPVGVVLSGGVDSSTITAVARRVTAEHALADLPTFTGYYDGADYDERAYATLVASSDHHEIRITPDDFVENFDAMLAAAREPYQGPGTFGQYMVAKYVADEMGDARVLSGEGGDELFGGYARLLVVAGEQPPDGYENYQLPDGYPTDLEQALQWDWDRLPDLLAVDDQMTDAHGLQAVAPLTDPRVVDYVLAQPAHHRVGKRMLKQAVAGIVPAQILNRTDKRGFPTPFVQWCQHDPARSFVLDRIGYIPDLADRWARGWWLDLCNADAAVAA